MKNKPKNFICGAFRTSIALRFIASRQVLSHKSDKGSNFDNNHEKYEPNIT